MNYKEAYSKLIDLAKEKGYKDLVAESEIIKPRIIINLRNKCGGCKYLNYGDALCIGYKCECSHKKYPQNVSYTRYYKPKTNKACRYYEQRNDIDLEYEYVHRGNIRTWRDE